MFGQAASHNGPIGVFDSGVGGLLVAAAIRRRLPREDILFLGDTARQPYGGHGRHVITTYAHQCCRKLLEGGAKMIVIACHTASAAALSELQASFGGHQAIIGMVEASCTALLVGAPSRVGILGTRHTIASGVYRQAVEERSRCRVLTAACPLWVPLVEEGVTTGRIAEAVVNGDLREMRRFRPHAVLLGCTHFPLMRALVSRRLGPKVSIITGIDMVASQVADTLTERGLQSTSVRPGKLELIFTDDGMPRDLLSFSSDLPMPDKVTWDVRLDSQPV